MLGRATSPSLLLLLLLLCPVTGSVIPTRLTRPPSHTREPFGNPASPSTTRDQALEKIQSLALLADILPTGFHGAVTAGVGPGTTVYIAGAGPVGLAAAASAHLLGAACVIVGDTNPLRLAQARSFGCETIDIRNGPVVRECVGRCVWEDSRPQARMCGGALHRVPRRSAGTGCGLCLPPPLPPPHFPLPTTPRLLPLVGCCSAALCAQADQIAAILKEPEVDCAVDCVGFEARGCGHDHHHEVRTRGAGRV
jgi:threonine dehydrogenase-like Zn-dependent dehydrogenase